VAAVGADHVLCAQPYSSISAADWPGARLSFTSTAAHFAIAITSDNGVSFLHLGMLDSNDISLSAGAESYGLAAIFAGASVTPQDGATYQVEVDNGSVLVGTVQFTYTVAAASSADTSALSRVRRGGLALRRLRRHAGQAARLCLPTARADIAGGARYRRRSGRRRSCRARTCGPPRAYIAARQQ
jgi:hypothetical protein